MSVVDRIIVGARHLSFGGPLGHLLERVSEHLPHWHTPLGHDGRPADNGHGDPRRRVTFTIAVIALGAKMARADGEVTRDEVAAFNEVFQVPPGEEAHMRTIFDLARRSTHGFESYARQVGRLFADDRAVLEDLLGGLFHIALADGEVCAAEDAYLREVARLFGFSAADYARIRATHAGPHPRTTRTRSSGSLPAPPPMKSASPITGWCASTIPTCWSRKGSRPKSWHGPPRGWRGSTLLTIY